MWKEGLVHIHEDFSEESISETLSICHSDSLKPLCKKRRTYLDIKRCEDLLEKRRKRIKIFLHHGSVAFECDAS